MDRRGAIRDHRLATGVLRRIESLTPRRPAWPHDEGQPPARTQGPATDMGAFEASTVVAVTVHEFYNAKLDRYFRTADDAEAAYITANPVATGEAVTNERFPALPRDAFPAETSEGGQV